MSRVSSIEPVGITKACTRVVVPNNRSRMVTAHSAMLLRACSRFVGVLRSCLSVLTVAVSCMLWHIHCILHQKLSWCNTVKGIAARPRDNTKKSQGATMKLVLTHAAGEKKDWRRDMNRTRVALLTTICLGCLMLSCGKSGASDQRLTNDIQSKLSADAVTSPAKVNVAVKDGVVTLSGDVPSSDVELEATKIANGASGVKGVNDQLKVNPALAANQLPNAGN